MPVSPSHQFLWVPVRPSTTGLWLRTVRTSVGWLGSVTSQISCAESAYARSRYILPGVPTAALPGTTRFICAPPSAPLATWRWKRYFGFLGSVTSTIDVPFNSFTPVSGLNDGRRAPVTGSVPIVWWRRERMDVYPG